MVNSFTFCTHLDGDAGTALGWSGAVASRRICSNNAWSWRTEGHIWVWKCLNSEDMQVVFCAEMRVVSRRLDKTSNHRTSLDIKPRSWKYLEMNKWSNQIQQVNTSQQEGQVFGKYDRELQKIYCKLVLMLKFYAIYNNDHLYHKCDQMILLVASAASSSTKIRSLSHFYVWTEQTCFSLCKQTLSVSAFYTNRLSAPTAWVWQLQETRNLPYQPWCRHKPHCVHSQKSGVVQIWHMYAYVFQNLRKNQYMLSCMVVSGLVPTSAICHGVCKWCAFELKTTQLSELTASYMLIMLFCVWTVLPKTLGVDKFGCIPTWWGRSLLSMPFVDVRNLPGKFLCRPAPPHITHTWLIDTNQECEKPSINHSSSSCCWCSIYMITT